MATLPSVTGPRRIAETQRGIASADTSAVGRGLEGLGATIANAGMDLMQRQRQEEDASAVFAARRQLDDWERTNLYDPQNGAVAKMGRDAFDLPQSIPKSFDAAAAKIAEGLTSQRQKAAFRELSTSRRDQALTFVDRHAFQQRQVFEEGQTNANVESMLQRAATLTNAGNLAQAKAEVDLAQTHLAGYYRSRGRSEEEIAGALRNLTSRAAITTVNLLLEANKPMEAEAFLKQSADTMKPDDLARAQGVVGKAVATRVGDVTADAIWSRMGPQSDRDPVTLDTMERTLRNELAGKPDAMKSGIAGLKERAAAFKDARRERDDQLEASVNQAILDGKSPRQVRSMPQFLALAPEQARKIADFMENRELRAVQRAAASEARADAAESRAERRLQRQGMGAYLTYSNPDTLSGMSEAQVLNLLPSLGNELTRDLMERKRALANPVKLAEARVDQDDFNMVAQEMGMHPFAAKTEDRKAELGTLKYRVEQMVSAAQQGGKKLLSRDEKLNLMRQEMGRTVLVDGWFTNDTVPVFALTPKQLDKVVVPKDDRPLIVEALRQQYQRRPAPEFEPTEANVRRLYLMRQSPDAARLLSNGR